jgi:hypothetical protein
MHIMSARVGALLLQLPSSFLLFFLQLRCVMRIIDYGVIALCVAFFLGRRRPRLSIFLQIAERKIEPPLFFASSR